ncbi:hypothetical protein QFZ66_000430 [Streptomyces sp. B4I13]|uniref:hypothetical protein n=1 Tax=Streptomyces sp. B4I13 TaxID=3042271 RepID=UPI0027806529|nr:hypothetical protein [Streptomyces sp. B4I13]MDQ0956552.1 hypothetical protein [Streptomyces sp. B4I13]
MTANVWNVLSGTGAAAAVLASDFPATGRTVAGFGDLVRELGDASPAVWETAPPRPGREAGMTGEDYLRHWQPGVEAAGPVNAVLGFCVGSVFAAGLAAEIGRRQGKAPRLVLFDPERPDADLLYRHYHELIGGLAPMLSPDEVDEARRAGENTRRAHTAMRPLAEELCELFGKYGEPAFRRTGLDAERGAEVVATFASFLGYLVAASDLDPREDWANAVAISSATPHSGLNPLPPRERSALVAREISFELPHTELLRDTGVARTVSELLA